MHQSQPFAQTLIDNGKDSMANGKEGTGDKNKQNQSIDELQNYFGKERGPKELAIAKVLIP